MTRRRVFWLKDMGIIRFGAQGWRARVDSGFDSASVARIAGALGSVWGVAPHGSRVLVGYDTRRDSERLALLVGQIVAAHGLEVAVSCCACPTPALGWAVEQDRRCVGGVMLTASEAPHEYGGLLVRHMDGGPITEGFADVIERHIATVPPTARGTVKRCDFVTPYMDALAAACDTAVIRAASPRVVIDTMHGAGSAHVAQLFERVGCTVIPLHNEAARDFRGLHPDPREPWVDQCEQTVVAEGACLGISFDGDCDRMGLIDAAGHLVSPHLLAPLVLEQLVRHHGVRGRVVASLGTSVRLERQAERLNCEFTLVPTGIEPLYREISEGDVLLAADAMGGISLPPHLPERDAIACALLLVELVATRGESVRALADELEQVLGSSEYGKLDVRVDYATAQRLKNLLPGLNPHEVMGQVPERVSHVDGLRLVFDDGSWVLVRSLPARPVVELRAEAATMRRVSELLGWGRNLI